MVHFKSAPNYTYNTYIPIDLVFIVFTIVEFTFHNNQYNQYNVYSKLCQWLDEGLLSPSYKENRVVWSCCGKNAWGVKIGVHYIAQHVKSEAINKIQVAWATLNDADSNGIIYIILWPWIRRENDEIRVFKAKLWWLLCFSLSSK